ncbi:MAG TPA: hypothetical protein VKE95_08250 [Burkholderiales bacterium]|nr:hypothetical protein [Burkholderiales bacterium]
MPQGSVSVVPTTGKVCKPFLLEVMVFSPESGFKFKVIVERSCTPEADEIWKLVFDLFQVSDAGTEVQLVHVSYTTATPVEQQSVQDMATEGVKPPQATVLVDEVHPAAKAVAGKKKPTAEQKKRVRDAMSKVVNVTV